MHCLSVQWLDKGLSSINAEWFYTRYLLLNHTIASHKLVNRSNAKKVKARCSGMLTAEIKRRRDEPPRSLGSSDSVPPRFRLGPKFQRGGTSAAEGTGAPRTRFRWLYSLGRGGSFQTQKEFCWLPLGHFSVANSYSFFWGARSGNVTQQHFV